jgi:hypothetical protein
MQTLRRILIIACAILGLAGSVGLASAAPLQGLDSAAAVVVKTQAATADAPHIENVWWHHHYWHRHYWHRYYWHRHYWHWHHWHHW